MRRPTPAEITRFNSKRTVTDGCWIWNAKRTHNGYGLFYFDHSTIYAHRFAYQLVIGPIPDGMQVDHLCRNRACVRPSHLEAVTPRENLLRSEHPNMIAHVTNTCGKGHLLDDAMLAKRVNPSGKEYTVRQCRECKRQRNRAAYARRAGASG